MAISIEAYMHCFFPCSIGRSIDLQLQQLASNFDVVNKNVWDMLHVLMCSSTCFIPPRLDLCVVPFVRPSLVPLQYSITTKFHSTMSCQKKKSQ